MLKQPVYFNWIKALFVAISVFISTFSFSQTSSLDKFTFDNLEDSIEKYVNLDYEKALVFANTYKEKGKKEGKILKEGFGFEAMIGAHIRNDEYKIGKQEFLKYLDFAKRNNESELIIRANLVGSDIELLTPDGAASLNYLNNALKVAEESENEFWRQIALNKMSSLFFMTGDKEKAVELSKRTANYFKNKKVDSTFSFEEKSGSQLGAYFGVCEMYRQMDKLDSAKHYAKLMKPSLKHANDCAKRYYYVNLGENLYAEEKYLEAKKEYDKSKKLCDTKNPLYDLNMDYRYGKIEYKLRNYPKAIEILKTGLDKYSVQPSEEGYMDEYYRILADCYKETGDFEKANSFFEKYINTKKQYSQTKGEVSDKMREREVTSFKTELKRLEDEKKSKNAAIIILILASSISILILLLLLLRFYRIRKKNEVRFEELMSKLNSEKSKVIDSKDSELEEVTTTDIAPEVTDQILTGLSDLEEKKYFLSKECNSYNVAKKIKTNTSYLSKVVNQEFEKNFNTYINDLRINHAIVQLKEDKRFRSFSIQSIAEELGYKSADSFTKYFKLRTGLNPSFYIKQLNTL